VWYHRGLNEYRVGLLEDFEVPVSMLEVAFGKGIADRPGGAVVDPNPQETLEFSVGDSSA